MSERKLVFYPGADEIRFELERDGSATITAIGAYGDVNYVRLSPEDVAKLKAFLIKEPADVDA